MAQPSRNNDEGSSLAALTFGNLVVGTGAAIVVGMLPSLSSDLHVTPGAAGQLISVFGFAACIGGPLLGGVTTRFERRNLLVAVLLATAFLNFVAAMAPGYWTLVLTRVVAGGIGVLHFSQAAITASLMAPPERRGRAMGMVFLGVALSSIVGLPLGALASAEYGWRLTVAGLGVLGLASAYLTWRLLPSGLKVPPVGRAGWVAIARHPLLTRALLVTVLQYPGQASLFFYLTIAYGEALNAGPGLVSIIMAMFGVSAATGNVFGGRLVDRFGSARVLNASVIGMFTGMVLFWLGHGSLLVMALGTVTWGAFSIIVNSAQQVRLVAIAQPLASVSVALNSSLVFLGQSFGGIIGGLTVTWLSPRALPLVCMPFLVMALMLSLDVSRRARAIAS